MKRIITIVFTLVIVLWIVGKSGCLNKFDINNPNEVKKYLMSKNFQHFEMKASMTSFLEFGDDEVKLIIYYGDKELTEKSYTYKLGEPKNDYREIQIDDNEGSWKIKNDGAVYLWNKGEIFVYNQFGETRK